MVTRDRNLRLTFRLYPLLRTDSPYNEYHFLFHFKMKITVLICMIYSTEYDRLNFDYKVKFLGEVLWHNCLIYWQSKALGNIVLTFFYLLNYFFVFYLKTDEILFKLYPLGLPSLSHRVCSQYGLDGSFGKSWLSFVRWKNAFNEWKDCNFFWCTEPCVNNRWYSSCWTTKICRDIHL